MRDRHQLNFSDSSFRSFPHSRRKESRTTRRFAAATLKDDRQDGCKVISFKKLSSGMGNENGWHLPCSGMPYSLTHHAIRMTPAQTTGIESSAGTVEKL
jgi:hypothetical protein